MPYSLRGNQPGCDGWAVVNTATGQTVTCHPTKKKALAHLRDLYAHVGDTTMQDLALNMVFPDAPGGMMGIGAAFDPGAVAGLDRDGLDAALDGIAAAANPGKNRGNAETLRRHWTTGPGAAKIRWGQPGDFDRCTREMIDDAKMTPEQAAGYCITGSSRVLPARVMVPVDEPVPGPDGLAAPALTGPLRRFAQAELRGAYDRYYVGEIILLRVASGYELSITPNHPVATCRGWVPAAKLQVGDHVLCSTGREWPVGTANPDVDDVPPAIEQVTQALPFRHVAVARAEHFHGDGSGSDIYEFATGPLLLDNFDAPAAEHDSQFIFSGRDVTRGRPARSLLRPAQLNAALSEDAVDVPDRDAIIAGDHDSGLTGLIPFGDGVALPCQLCLEDTGSVRHDSVAMQDVADRPVRAGERGGDGHRRFPGGIAPQYVVSVQRQGFEGHVYNLDTSAGCYLAESILVHNCNLLHHRALGYYPATHKKMEHGGTSAAADPDAAAWDESAHLRVPAGQPGGGQFAPASGASAPTNQNPVGEGETGQRVTDLQKRLTELGYKVDADGKFGPKTLAAVRAFQQANGLKVDGLVGPKTTAALRGKTPAGKKDTKTTGGQKKKLSDKPGSMTPAQKTQVQKMLNDRQVPDDAKQAILDDLPTYAESEMPNLTEYLNSFPPRKKAAAAESAPDLPALVTIPGVDILAAGTWQLSTGRQTFTRQDLQSAIEAAQCPAVGSPLIKIGHLDDRFTPTADGEPAIGKVTNMRLNDAGTKITGDLAGMPGWLAGIAASAFPRRSVEGKYGFTCQIGHQHPFVVTALALLGVTPPGVGVLSGLDDIAALYGVQAASGEWHTEPIEPEEGPVVAVTEEDVRRAYYAAGPPHTRWITELQMAPTQLIVADDADSKLYRVPFSIEAEAVSFGDPEEIDSYAGVAAARGTGTIIAWASAEESRAVTAGTLPPWLKPGGGKTTSDTGSTGGYQVKTGVKGCFGHAVVDSAGKIVTGGCHPDQASAEKHLATLTKNAAAADQGNISAANAADLDAAARRYCASQGWAMPDGSYPIRPANMHGAQDLASAIRAVGRGSGSHNQIRAHIMKRASAIGMPDRIPANWGKSGTTSAAAGDEQDHGGDEQQDLEAAAGHGPFSGEHAHPHTANGDQGGDKTHDHPHAHDGDWDHAHPHGPVSAAPPAAPAASNQEEVRQVDFTDQQLAAIRAKLGKTDGEEVTPAEIAAAFTDAPAITASAGTIPKPNEELGVYLVEASVLHDWKKAAEAGERAATELRHSQREEVLAAAVRDGKIPQSRLDHWRRAWEADEEYTRNQLEHLAKGFVPVGPAIGAAGLDPDLPGGFEEQMTYKQLYGAEEGIGVRRG